MGARRGPHAPADAEASPPAGSSGDVPRRPQPQHGPAAERNVVDLGRLRIRVDQPRRTLSDAQRAVLVPELVRLAATAFRSGAVSADDVVAHAFEADTTIFVFEGDRLVGFAASRALRSATTHLCYLSGTILEPTLRQTGLYDLLVGARLGLFARRLDPAALEASMFGARAQNPRVVRRMAQLGCYPVGVDVDLPRVREAARFLASRLSGPLTPGAARFDATTRVARGAYGGPLYTTLPSSGLDDLDRFCASQLDVARGDAFVLVGRWNQPLVAELVASSLARLGASPAASRAVHELCGL